MLDFRTAVNKWKQGSLTTADIEYYFGHLDAFFYEVMHELEGLYNDIDDLDTDRLRNVFGVIADE